MLGIASAINQKSLPQNVKKRKASEYITIDDVEASPSKKKFKTIDPPAVFDRRSTKRKRTEEDDAELPRKRVKHHASGIFKRPRSPSLAREEPPVKKTKITHDDVEDPAYNDFNYWRTPLLDVEDIIRELNTDMKY